MVFAAFATSGITFVKMIGVGMVLAIAIDATIVRTLLVPSSMQLLGQANWWAPGPMLRWWEKYELPRERRRRLGGTPRPIAGRRAGPQPR